MALLATPVYAEEPAPWERASYDPAWAGVKHTSEYRLEYRDDLGDALNAKRLTESLGLLKPGERLLIGPGTWSVRSKVDITAVGTASKPIWIEALDPKRPPVITRPDAKQNVLNLGESGRVRYLVLRNLEITGGSTHIRIGDGQHVWIDRCHLHDGGGEGITANARDTSHIHLTRNHIHDFKHPRATGEGMYLGANHGKRRMSYSVIALNHIHDCAGEQGDGIEIKQGSHHNWIVENHVHDTKYPCILVYGTGGNGINLIERNTCYRSQDNVMQ
ncbi:MAG: right-handed parallel beta-helix repeat-containing protein, partial [Planctomycetota bacterium]